MASRDEVDADGARALGGNRPDARLEVVAADPFDEPGVDALALFGLEDDAGLVLFDDRGVDHLPGDVDGVAAAVDGLDRISASDDGGRSGAGDCFGDREGQVSLIEPSREALKVVGRMAIPEQTKYDRKKGAIWTHPVIAGQTLFLRDQNLIFAYDVAAE